jgi:hypothetical protein
MVGGRASIISSIFSFLRSCDDLLGRCMLVCRHWFNIVPLPSSCTHYNSCYFPSFAPIDRGAPMWLSHIQHINVTDGVFQSWLPYLSNNTRLISLTLELEDFSDSDLPSKLLLLTQLKRLNLVGVTHLDLSLLQHPSLTDCTFESVSFAPQSPSFVMISSRLRYLSLGAVEDSGNAYIIDLTNAFQLATLWVSGNWIIQNGHGSSLHDLTYYFTDDDREEVKSSQLLMDSLSKWNRLKRVTLGGIRITTLPMDSIRSWQHVDLSTAEVTLPQQIIF